MKILVACEESQAVTKELRRLGHEAYSCDIEPCSGGHPEWHIMGDVLPLLNGNCQFKTMDGGQHNVGGKWDMIIAFPPCTYLSNVATRQFSPKFRTAEQIAWRWEQRFAAAEFFMLFANADCERISIENPVGYMNSTYRKPDQIIHPYWFGDPYTKRTCLWLKGLPKLEPTNVLSKPEPMYYLATNGKAIYETEGKRGITGGQSERAKARSKTFPGIARAMAEQWAGEAT